MRPRARLMRDPARNARRRPVLHHATSADRMQMRPPGGPRRPKLRSPVEEPLPSAPRQKDGRPRARKLTLGVPRPITRSNRTAVTQQNRGESDRPRFASPAACEHRKALGGHRGPPARAEPCSACGAVAQFSDISRTARRKTAQDGNMPYGPGPSEMKPRRCSPPMLSRPGGSRPARRAGRHLEKQTRGRARA